MDCLRYTLNSNREISEVKLFIGPWVTLNLNLLNTLKVSILDLVQSVTLISCLSDLGNKWVGFILHHGIYMHQEKLFKA